MDVVGSVLAKHMFGILKQGQAFDDNAYTGDLDALSAERWLAECGGAHWLAADVERPVSSTPA